MNRAVHTLAVLVPVLVIGIGAIRSGPAIESAPTVRWVLRADLQIGRGEGAGQELTQILEGGAAVSESGEFHLLQARDAYVNVYKPDGRFARQIGRRGGGPGEFSMPGNIGFLGDSFWVTDYGAARVTVMNAGQQARTIPTPKSLDRQGRQFSLSAWLGDRRILAASLPRPEEMALPKLRKVALVAAVGNDLDTIAMLDVGHKVAVVRRSKDPDLRTMSAIQHFDDSDLISTTNGGEILLVSRTSPTRPTGSIRLTKYSNLGKVLFTRSYAVKAHAVGSRSIDSVVNRSADYVVKSGISKSQGEARQLVRQAFFLPAFYPTVSAVTSNRGGDIWIQREVVGNATTFMVLSSDGSVKAEVTGPPGITMIAVDNAFVWAKMTDELDVPYVVRLRIQR
jgi:hypothetical protein